MDISDFRLLSHETPLSRFDAFPIPTSNPPHGSRPQKVEISPGLTPGQEALIRLSQPVPNARSDLGSSPVHDGNVLGVAKGPTSFLTLPALRHSSQFAQQPSAGRLEGDPLGLFPDLPFQEESTEPLNLVFSPPYHLRGLTSTNSPPGLHSRTLRFAPTSLQTGRMNPRLNCSSITQTNFRPREIEHRLNFLQGPSNVPQMRSSNIIGANSLRGVTPQQLPPPSVASGSSTFRELSNHLHSDSSSLVRTQSLPRASSSTTDSADKDNRPPALSQKEIVKRRRERRRKAAAAATKKRLALKTIELAATGVPMKREMEDKKVEKRTKKQIRTRENLERYRNKIKDKEKHLAQENEDLQRENDVMRQLLDKLEAEDIAQVLER